MMKNAGVFDKHMLTAINKLKGRLIRSRIKPDPSMTSTRVSRWKMEGYRSYEQFLRA